MAYLVNQGTRELGIRLALGAAPRAILLLIVRRGMAVACTGLAVGLVAAVLLTRYMAGMLFRVDARDPFTFTVIPTALALAALAASYAPARRAARIDPMISLRSE
jgi:ABC-type antimicrobial peptide transport system permease subunit